MEELLSNKIFMDLLGYIAIVFSVAAFLDTNINRMRIFGMISTFLFGISIYFYKGLNGLFVSFISFFTKLLGFYINENQTRIITYLSPIPAFILYFYFNEKGWVGALPALSLIFIIIADMQKDIVKMKMVYYGSATCWLTYGFMLGSLPAIIFDIFGIISITLGIYITLKKRKRKRNNLSN